MMKLLSSIRVGISPKDTKVVCGPVLFFFPVWVVLMRAEHNRGLLWMWFTINWDWVFINRKSIREITVQDVDWDSPGSPSASNHGASRHNQASWDSIRTKQKDLDKDS
jgi:hypothetical protein